MKLFQHIFSVILLMFTVSFAVSNRQEFALTLWPFPFEVVLPIGFAVLFFALVFFILGGFYSWLIALPGRVEKRFLAKKVSDLEKQVQERKES